MRHRVLLLGAAGQLGIELERLLGPEYDLTAVSRKEADLTDGEALRAVVRSAKPRFIVNAAAYTAVDRAESEPELAHAVNAGAPAIVAEECLRTGAWLLHYSTDYVFDGSGTMPWRETDPTGPLGVYGRSKLAGEEAIAATGCRHLILRTSWVYAAHSQNFLRTMLRLGGQRPKLSIVDDQVGAPTSAGELAAGTGEILHRLADAVEDPALSGVYHMACGGETSWFGFAQAIFSAFAGMVPTPELVPIPSEAYPTPAMRPRNSRLNCDKLEAAFGTRLPLWQEGLARVAAEDRAAGF